MEANDPNAVAYVRMEFIGTRSGAVTYPGLRGSGRNYRAGRNPTNRFHNVHPGDVATLEGSGEFRRVAPAVIDHIPTPPTSTPPMAAPIAVTVAEVAVGGLESELVAEAVPVVELAPIVEQVQVINDASGKVTRKRATKKATKVTKLRDLPPLG